MSDNSIKDVIVLTESGGLMVPGEPEYFVTDDTFSRLLSENNFAKCLYEKIGKKVCIGRLGRLISKEEDLYSTVELDFSADTTTPYTKVSLHYYEKVY